MTDNSVDLKLILRQIEALLPLRDDLTVQYAMLQRIDATLGGLSGEVRALHAAFARINARVVRLEDKVGTLEAG
jgi:hypothetical protein